MTRKRTLVAAVSFGLVALLLAGVAAAGPLRARHPIRRHVVRTRVVRTRVVRTRVARVVRKHAVKRHVFAPESIRAAAEVTAVMLDPLTQQFAQVTFDRGRVTAVSSGTITLQQKQGNAVWRTQAFTVPSGAVVTFNGKAVALSQIPTGASARVETSGTPGGAGTVVRVNAYDRGEAPLPATTG